MVLSEAKAGDRLIIKKIYGENGFKARLSFMGLIENTKIKVIRFSPLGDPMQIYGRGFFMAIRKKNAEDIEVEYE